MTRILCTNCQRPKMACICSFISKMNNDIQVVILQHPNEKNQAKNTIAILQKSLKHSVTFVGESFDNNNELKKIISQYHDGIVLLYPSKQATIIDYNHDKCFIKDQRDKRQQINQQQIKCMIILDATWKKSFRMYSINTFLQKMPHIKLPEGIESLYKIRKVNKKGALSSLEACCHALSRIENNTSKYQPLLNNFIKFNQFQLSFRK